MRTAPVTGPITSAGPTARRVGNGRAPSRAPANDTRQSPQAHRVRAWYPRSRRAVLVAWCWSLGAGRLALATLFYPGRRGLDIRHSGSHPVHTVTPLGHQSAPLRTRGNPPVPSRMAESPHGFRAAPRPNPTRGTGQRWITVRHRFARGPRITRWPLLASEERRRRETPCPHPPAGRHSPWQQPLPLWSPSPPAAGSPRPSPSRPWRKPWEVTSRSTTRASR